MQRAPAAAFALVRSAVLGHVRLPVAPSLWSRLGDAPAAGGAPSRGFAESAGTYLDKKAVTERVLDVVKKFQKVDPSKVTPTAHFQKDLGLDSLDGVEVVMAFEEEFAVEIPDADADKITSCEDAINYIASHPQAK
ncbi:hypothetical protein CLOM_g11079 [Closterium sp. NIES-68]|nr:hypothetical protein CLOM_g402 [Closterium sp. NIES-68]GJP51949.1 hypothetical protein CLOM_g11079 [Closterium sp. NIES-68]